MDPSNETRENADQMGFAVALARIEEGQKSTAAAVGRIEAKIDGTTATVARHDIDIALLKERQPKKTPWYFTVGAVVGIITVTFLVGSAFFALAQVIQTLK